MGTSCGRKYPARWRKVGYYRWWRLRRAVWVPARRGSLVGRSGIGRERLSGSRGVATWRGDCQGTHGSQGTSPACRTRQDAAGSRSASTVRGHMPDRGAAGECGRVHRRCASYVGSGGRCAPSSWRAVREERGPLCVSQQAEERMRTKPRGSTCSRKRRTNLAPASRGSRAGGLGDSSWPGRRLGLRHARAAAHR